MLSVLGMMKLPAWSPGPVEDHWKNVVVRPDLKIVPGGFIQNLICVFLQ